MQYKNCGTAAKAPNNKLGKISAYILRRKNKSRGSLFKTGRNHPTLARNYLARINS